MTISEKIFELLDTKGISQKEFSLTTGIPQSIVFSNRFTSCLCKEQSSEIRIPVAKRSSMIAASRSAVLR